MMTRKFSALALALALTFGATTSGCFGKFALTRKVYNWNDTISNKFVKTLVFWGLNIVPVYELAGAGDYFIFNVIEFWTGTNVIGDAARADHKVLADGTVELRLDNRTYHLVPRGEHSFDVVIDGERFGSADIVGENDLTFTTARDGRVVRMHASDDQLSAR